MENNQLSEKLKQLRKSKKLRQIDVAVALDIEQSTYSGYETGRHNPNPDMIIRIATFYEINVDILMRLASPEYQEKAIAPLLVSDLSSQYQHNHESQHGDIFSSAPLLDPQKQADILSGYLSYVDNPLNKKRLLGLTTVESQLLYLFSEIPEDDRIDLLEIMKLKLARKKNEGSL